MRKFLAVLLTVAILGVAGAAFAVGAGHVTPTPGETSTGKKVVVDAEAVTKKADIVAKEDVHTEGAEVGEVSSKASEDIKALANKGIIVAAVVPELKVTSTANVSIDVNFDEAYVGQKVSADLRKEAASKVALAGGTQVYFVSQDKGASTDVVPESKKLILVAEGLDAGTYNPLVTIAATGEIKGVAEEYDVPATVYNQVSEDYGAEPIVIKAGSGSASEKATTDGKLVVAFGKLSFDKTGVYLTDEKSFSTFSNASGDMTVVFDSDYVSVAAEAALSDGNVYSSSTGKKVTSGVITGNGSVAFKVNDASAAHTVGVVADKKADSTNDPTSSKGSGGCNAGFASIAVLALGLAALRRKAR